MFKKAKQNRVFQDVVEQIQDAIVSGRLTPGSRLPAERELKDMFNTSRGTLREALRVLEQKGLIEIRLGVSGGAIVKRVNSDSIAESLALLIQSGTIPLDHLYEFRIKLEGGVAELAAQRATPEDIAEMKTLQAEAKACIDSNDIDGFLMIDETLHNLLGHISRNKVFQFVQKSIHDNIHRYYSEYLPMDRKSCLENYHDFEEIIAAIENRDSLKAAKCLMDHVYRFKLKMITRPAPPA